MLSNGKIKELVGTLKTRIEYHSLDIQELGNIMTLGLGGSDAAGAWDWRLAFDLMQIAAGRAATIDPDRAEQTLSQLSSLMQVLPTETRRSERQVQLQQFSSPLDLAFVVSQAAQVRSTDVVLEPSAGTGALAAMVSHLGATLLLNELDERRRAMLSAFHGRAVQGHDAEFIADLLEVDVAPGVVLMNPPFASSATRTDPTIAARHVLSAVKTLQDGGRLVAIVPPSVSAKGDAGLWRRICGQATPVLRLHLPRPIFRKMGRSVTTDLLVMDKGRAGGPESCTELSCSDLQAALSMIRDLCPARLPLMAVKPSSPSRPRPVPARSPSRGRKMMLPGQGSVVANATAPLEIEIYSEPRSNQPVSDIYASYAPQRISITGAQPHPSPLVESLAMGSVHPPCPGLQSLSLPKSLVTEGLLSEAQLETILIVNAEVKIPRSAEVIFPTFGAW